MPLPENEILKHTTLERIKGGGKRCISVYVLPTTYNIPGTTINGHNNSSQIL